MRFARSAAAIGAALLAMPAQAVPHLYVINVSGWVTGTTNVYAPNQVGCNGGSPNLFQCNTIGPWSSAVGATISIVGENPTGPFSFGNAHANGELSGTIIGGVLNGLSGVNLTYNYSLLQTPIFKYGTAPTFFATLVSIDGQAAPAPVPEPATWGLLLLGFGGVGAMLRRRQMGVSYASS